MTKTIDSNKFQLIRLALSLRDFAAIDHIQTRYHHATRSATIRFAINQQVIRDKLITLAGNPSAGTVGGGILAGGAVSVHTHDRVTRRVLDCLKDSDDHVRQWAMRVPVEDLELFNKLKDQWGLESRVDVVRFAVRTQAVLDGFPEIW